MGSGPVKAIMWSLLVVGLVGAGVGISELHVPWTVASLIVASVSGLVLLRIRADAHPELHSERRMLPADPPSPLLEPVRPPADVAAFQCERQQFRECVRCAGERGNAERTEAAALS